MKFDNNDTVFVKGFSKAQAKRAINWLRARSLLAFYQIEDKSLRVYITKDGRSATYGAMWRAIDATR